VKVYNRDGDKDKPHRGDQKEQISSKNQTQTRKAGSHRVPIQTGR